MSDTLLSPRELAAYLGVPVKSLYVWRHNGHGPQGIRVGKHIRYRRAAVEQWLDEQADQQSGGGAA